MIGLDIIFPSEEKQLENLKKYKILCTKQEPIFDQLAVIAAIVLNVPIAMINFIDRHKVWVKADLDDEAGQEADHGLCSLAILNEYVNDFELIVKEPWLISNPLVAGEHGLRFYATIPVTTDEGFNVGMICIVDKISRTFTTEEQKKLEWIATMVRLEMNKKTAVYSVA